MLQTLCFISVHQSFNLYCFVSQMHIHIKPIDVLAEMNSGVRPLGNKAKFFGTSLLQADGGGADNLLLPQVLGLQKASGLGDFQSSRVSQSMGSDGGVVRVPSVTVCQKIIREECIELDENGDVINVTVDHRKLPQTEIIHNHNNNKACESQLNDSTARSLAEKQLMLNADTNSGGGGGGNNNNNNNSSSSRPGMMSSPVSPPSHENHMSQMHPHNVQLSPSDKNSMGQRSHPHSGGIITSSSASSSSSAGVQGSDSIATSAQNNRFAYLDQRGFPESYLMSMDATLRRNAFPIPLSRASVGMEHLPIQGASPAHRPLDGHDFYGAHLPRLPLATHMHLSTAPSRMGDTRTFTTLGN